MSSTTRWDRGGPGLTRPRAGPPSPITARSGHAAIVFAFLLVMAAEGLAVHILLRMWSPLAAWLFTTGTAYGALWLIADYRATVLRPILVGDESILVRAGFRCTLRVPRACIAEVGRQKPEFGKASLNLTFLGTPTRWLTLSEPMLALGPYGLHRRVRAIGIEPDTPDELDRILQRSAGWSRVEYCGSSDADC